MKRAVFLGLAAGLWAVCSCADQKSLPAAVSDCRSADVECSGATRCLADESGDFHCRLLPGAGSDGGGEGAADVGEGATPRDAGSADGGRGGWVPGASADAASDAAVPPRVDASTSGGGTADAGGDTCGRFRRLLKPHPDSVARVMLVVDRSYSMVEDQDRWTPISQALNGVTAALHGAVHFGLLLFPHPTLRNPPPGVPEPCIPGVVNVEPGPDRQEQIVQWLGTGEPADNMGTPTASALQTAADWLRQAPTGNDYILLATDGGPGCNTALDPLECVCNARASNCCLFQASHNCLDDAATTALIADLARSGIRTMVLGITEGQEAEGDACGPTPACGPNSRCVYGTQECVNGSCRNQLSRVLDDMAVAGQTAVNGRHFEVANLEQLEDQVAAAAGSVAPCVYELNALAEHADRLVVSIDDQAIPRDRNHRNGWDVRDGNIEFFGEACRTLRNGHPHEINAACE